MQISQNGATIKNEVYLNQDFRICRMRGSPQGGRTTWIAPFWRNMFLCFATDMVLRGQEESR